MKKIKKYVGIGLAVAVLFFSACSKKLDIAPPNNIQDQQIKDLLASGDTTKIRLIMGSMANNMPLLFNWGALGSDASYSTNQGMYVMRSLEGNDMILGDQPLGTLAGSTEYELGNFQSQNNQRENALYWLYAWRVITTANQMLNYLPTSVVTNSFLQNAKARGLVVRAFMYNFLMENYQDAYMQGGKDKPGLPIYTQFNPNQPYKGRSSSADTYKFIRSDLDTAIQLLTASNTGYTADPSDIDLGVANFVLARVAIVTGDWPTAITACNNILAKYPNLLSQANYGGTNTGTAASPVFDPQTNGFFNNAVNPEVILGFAMGVANTGFITLMNPFGGGYGGLNTAYKRIDNRLYDQITTLDYRKDAFQGGTPFGNYKYPQNNAVNTLPSYINFKFASTKGFNGNPINSDQSTCYYMRSSEVLLMKAEAQAQSGDGPGAQATLNTLLAARTRSGNPALTCANYPAMTGMNALQMVQLQTRIEMWGEFGLEFYNNKRWNIPVNRSNSASHVNKGSMPVSKMTIQIPDDEMNNNPNMIQNN